MTLGTSKEIEVYGRTPRDRFGVLTDRSRVR